MRVLSFLPQQQGAFSRFQWIFWGIGCNCCPVICGQKGKKCNKESACWCKSCDNIGAGRELKLNLNSRGVSVMQAHQSHLLPYTLDGPQKLSQGLCIEWVHRCEKYAMGFHIVQSVLIETLRFLLILTDLSVSTPSSPAPSSSPGNHTHMLIHLVLGGLQ